MRWWCNSTGSSHVRSKTSSKAWFAMALGLLWVQSAWADVCVWRDPERTMVRLFPQAQDYRTRTYKLDASHISRIEALIGEPLDATEKHEFSIYVITAEQRVLGWVLALAGRGEYGTIETVIGLEPDHRIRGVYLQRIRERARNALQSDAFLGQFKGKGIKDSLNITPVAEAPAASAEIARVVKRMLAFDAALNSSPQTAGVTQEKAQ